MPEYIPNLSSEKAPYRVDRARSDGETRTIQSLVARIWLFFSLPANG